MTMVLINREWLCVYSMDCIDSFLFFFFSFDYFSLFLFRSKIIYIQTFINNRTIQLYDMGSKTENANIRFNKKYFY